jgi:hypothetical protein
MPKSANMPVRCVVLTTEPEIMDISAFCIPIEKSRLPAKYSVSGRNKDNPIIQKIRNLDPNDIDYEIKKKKLKQRLPNITPNCTVSYRDDRK